MADFDVEFIDRDERNARFVVRGLTPAFATGIRRAMIADVPTMSIDTVRVIENSSVMFDEVIGLRLGLVPLTTPVDEFEPGDTVTLSLDVEGPEERGETVTAYSGDIQTSDDMVRPADENIPIIDLKAGQRLSFEAEAVLGRGRDHAKHQGGVSVGYRHLQTVEVGDELGEYDEREPNIVRGVIDEQVPRQRGRGPRRPRGVRLPRGDGRFLLRRGPRHERRPVGPRPRRRTRDRRPAVTHERPPTHRNRQ